MKAGYVAPWNDSAHTAEPVASARPEVEDLLAHIDAVTEGEA